MKLVLCFFVAFGIATSKSQIVSSSKFDSLVDHYVKMNWNGVVIYGTPDSMKFIKAFGYAEIEQKRVMQTSTFFKTESVGKMFTAVRILQLCDAGQLSLTDRLSELLPSWKVPNAKKITIQHLLSHSSGLTSPWENPLYVFGKEYSEDELKQIIESTPLNFSVPGEKTYYSNTAFMLLEKIIERKDKMPFARSIQRHVFSPAGMTQITELKDSVLPANAAQPYYQITSDRFIKDETKYGKGLASGAGGWLSNAEDLFRFAQAYMKGKLLSSRQQLIQRTNNHQIPDTSNQARFGLFPLVIANGPKTIVGHNGGGKGFSVDVFFDFECGRIVVFCSNQWGTGYGLTRNFFRLANQQEIIVPRHSVEVALCDYLVTYKDSLFNENPQQVFDQLKIKAVERNLLNVQDNLALLNKLTLASSVLRYTRQQYPRSAFTWMRSGDNALLLGRNKDARDFFSQALELAISTNNKWVQGEVERKLKTL